MLIISVRDAEELAKCVYYYKAIRPGGRVVMMGHSTGTHPPSLTLLLCRIPGTPTMIYTIS